MAPLVVALFLAMVVNRVLEAAAAPIKERYPELNTWWLIYVAWALAALLTWLSAINLFVDYLPNELVGRLLTAIVVGGGANLLHDLFDTPEGVLIEGEVIDTAGIG